MGNSESSTPQTVREKNIYQGEKNEANEPHGHGVLLYASDDSRSRESYTGQWMNGKRHGQGKLVWVNQAVYEGDWKNDKLDGYGKLVWTSGMKYSGEWKDNKFHGCGTLTYKNGKKYEGSWRNNKFHGIGMLTYAPQDTRKRISYTGEWKQGKRDGLGKMEWRNSAEYQGEWRQGKRSGMGQHRFPNGEMYIGSWSNGRRDGAGQRIFANNARFIGIWKANRKDGVGVYIMPHGRREKQEYVNGVLQDQTVFPVDPQPLRVYASEVIAKDDVLFKKSVNLLPGDIYLGIQQCREILKKSKAGETNSYQRRTLRNII